MTRVALKSLLISLLSENLMKIVRKEKSEAVSENDYASADF